jgi:hypothetical protein
MNRARVGGHNVMHVTEGFDAAIKQAKAAARDGDVDIAGGASTVRQALAAGRSTNSSSTSFPSSSATVSACLTASTTRAWSRSTSFTHLMRRTSIASAAEGTGIWIPTSDARALSATDQPSDADDAPTLGFLPP